MIKQKYFIVLICLSVIGNIFAQAPDGYYNSAENTSDQSLRDALHNIIDDHTKFDYTSNTATDTWDILKESDVDPNLSLIHI